MVEMYGSGEAFGALTSHVLPGSLRPAGPRDDGRPNTFYQHMNCPFRHQTLGTCYLIPGPGPSLYRTTKPLMDASS